MGLIEILLVAVGLALDAFVVSLSAAASGQVNDPRPAFRLSFHFGLFQALMPILGWSLGIGLERWVTAFDHWIAFGLLALVGGRMAYAGLMAAPDTPRDDMTRGWSLLMLCIATSVDALAVGFSLALLEVTIWYPSVVIGGVTASLSLVGVRLGNRLSRRFGQRMEFIGGLILIGIGLRILQTHGFGLSNA